VEAIIHWLEQHQLSCFYKSAFGIECPGCGSQRAFIFLLKGDLPDSFNSYPPLVLFLILFIFLILHLVFKFRNGGTFLKYIFILTAAVVMVNFIYRLTMHT